MIDFDFRLKTRIIYGCGSVSRLGSAARELHARRALLVTDAGIEAAGLLERAMHGLEFAGIEYVLYDQTHENPTGADIQNCESFARDAGKIDLLIGYGGGSSLDTAKGANFLLTNGGRMEDYRGSGRARNPLLPMIAVPTTAGTGSEVQSFAVIGDSATHLKIACGDPSATPRVAVLDPELTITQPPMVTACTGIDAISHAVETAVTRRRNRLSLLFSEESLRLTMRSYPRALETPDDLAARGDMLLGACLAGVAIENSMLGAAHAAANPLTARFGTIHGAAVGSLLPYVVRRNARDAEIAAQYRSHFAAAGVINSDEPAAAAVDRIVEMLDELARKSVGKLIPARPDGAVISEMANEAAVQMTAMHNPVTYAQSDFEELYNEAL